MTRNFLLASFALAVILPAAPAAFADIFTYSISGQNFSADLTFTASQIGGQPQGVDRITGVTGTFTDPDTGLVTLSSSNPATMVPDHGAIAPNFANNGWFLYDNVLYTKAPGNGILDWGGLLFSVGSYQLNIFSDSTNGNAGYFYWADNGATHWNDPIPVGAYTPSTVSGGGPHASGSLTALPEPASLMLLGTGLLGVAALIFRQGCLDVTGSNG
jgi:hypothetical protein